MPFTITRENITTLGVDAIVNATGRGLNFSEAEHELLQQGGTDLVAAREALGELLVGETKVTPSFDLGARYVIHVRGPQYQDGRHHEHSLLELVYTNALQEAEKLGCQSIAFPLIGAVTTKFPRGVAMEIALEAIKNFLKQSEMVVHLVVTSRSSYLITQSAKHEFDDFLAPRNQKFATHVMFAMPQRRARSRRASGLENDHDQEMLTSNIDFTEMRPDETFTKSLFRLIDHRGLNDVEVYKKANIDRKLFSKIRSNIEYQPSKNTVILLALALQLSLDETKDLLKKAGYALSPSSKFDLIIEYCIDNDFFDIFKINQILFTYTNKVLVGI